MLLEISGEITPERMNGWIQSKNSTVVDVTGNRSMVPCCKHQYCIGTWNVSEKLLLIEKTPGFLAYGVEEFNLGPETRLDRSELLCNKILLTYQGDRESF